MSIINSKTESETGDTGELHIAGIIVYAQHAHLNGIKQAIALLPGAEIHAVTEQGKLIVTLEGRDTSEVANQMSALHVLPGVYSATMVYQHHENIESLNEEITDETDPSHIY